MTRPTVSVIVPLFKTEPYVEKCLRSLMVQTLRDIEILCIDDCSPDGSAAIVERLAQEDDRIVLIRHEVNLGLGGARNTGIRAARADYIASVDSDDYVEPDFLQRLWEGSKNGHYDVVVCGYARVRPDGKVIDRPGRGKTLTLDPLPADQNPIRISEPAFWNKLWRRSLYVDNDIWFPDHIYHQDSATTPRIYTKARNVRFIGGSYYNYLIRSDSVTQSTSDKHLLDRYRSVDVLKDFFLKEGLYDRLKDAIEERIYSGYSYHVGNVVQNRHGGDKATDDYLRYLLIMREAYLQHDMTVRSMSLDQKIDYLINHKPLLRPIAEVPLVQPNKNPEKITDRPPLPKTPRVLILTLYSGENEFESGCTSLQAQTHTNWEHRVFRGMGNHEAHAALYTCIMGRTSEFDLFLKLDADMAFARPNALEEIIQMFRDRSSLDHLVIGCDDYMTGETILGVHTFSNRVKWQDDERGLFNDPSPKRPGTRKIVEIPNKPYFTHAANPSSLQVFHFGAHRALKLVQRGYEVEQKRVLAMQSQWKALQGLWTQYTRHGDRRHALALVAADLIINGTLGDEAHDYRDPQLLAAFESHAQLPGAELAAMIRAHWDSPQARKAYFERAVGAAGLEKLARAQAEVALA